MAKLSNFMENVRLGGEIIITGEIFIMLDSE